MSIQSQSGTLYDPLVGPGGTFDFNEKNIRHGFIRKVYCILMAQLVVTVSFITLFLYQESCRVFVQQNPSTLIIAFIITIGCILAMACFDSIRRKTPTNFIFLGVFTCAEGFLLGVISSTYKADTVLMAVGITAIVCFALTLFAFQTKYDFTSMASYIFVSLVVLLMFGILAMFLHNRIVELVYACMGALFFSLYLVFDTQMMIGGKHKYTISPEEYIFAALNLYLDIVNLFLYILQIIAQSQRN